jgi:hypothetical protein
LDAELSAALMRLAEDFDFPSILNVLAEAAEWERMNADAMPKASPPPSDGR